ncbi:hypothetical protein ISF6_4602 [Piscinibacter sakaiensis]|uniref:Uncharacterized protein n=1 Tax=Piscinibacter sakaiensis TaxID=1547922 RepID=A0A0K8NVK9_PISS1|nr:hypothetical protein ISF6_4602 [Piscinibacter sakaiensis]
MSRAPRDSAARLAEAPGADRLGSPGKPALLRGHARRRPGRGALPQGARIIRPTPDAPTCR